MNRRVRNLLGRYGTLAAAALVAGLLVAWVAAEGAPARAAWRQEVAARGVERYLVATLAEPKPELPAWTPEALAAIAGAPGVRAVAWASGVLRGFGPEEGFRLVSPAYLGYAGVELLEGEARVGGVLAPERAARGPAPAGLPETGRYRGSGPWLVVADGRLLAGWSPPVRVFEVALRTEGPASRHAARVEAWARARGLLPEGVRLEPGSALFHPDRSRLRDPELRALHRAGYGFVLLAAGFALLGAGTAAFLAVRRGERARLLRYLFGADPRGLFLGELGSYGAAAGIGYLIGVAGGLFLAGSLPDAPAAAAILALGALLLTAVAAGAVPGVRGLRIQGALHRAGALPRTPGAVAGVRAVVLLSTGLLAFALAAGLRARDAILAWIDRAGGELYLVAPEFAAGGTRRPVRLDASTLRAIEARWPGLPVALVSRFPRARLRTESGESRPVGLVASLGAYREAVGLELREGDERGLVVTARHADLLGTRVRLALGPVELVPCRVTGVARGTPGVPHSPRLPPGWVWVDAGGPCFGDVPYRSILLAVRDAGGRRAQAIAAWLSARYPEAPPFRARAVAGAGRARLGELWELASEVARGFAGAGILGLLALALLAREVLSAWGIRLALAELLGAGPRELGREARGLALGLFGLPAALGTVAGGVAGGLPALALGSPAWLLLAAALARRLVRRRPPARSVVGEAG